MRASATFLAARRAHAPSAPKLKFCALWIIALLAFACLRPVSADARSSVRAAERTDPGATVRSAARISLSVTSPVPGAVVSGSVRWRVVARSRDGVRKVRFFVDGRLAWVEGMAPWVFGGDRGFLHTFRFRDGEHELTAIATSRRGRSARRTVKVRFANSPIGLPGDAHKPASPPAAAAPGTETVADPAGSTPGSPGTTAGPSAATGEPTAPTGGPTAPAGGPTSSTGEPTPPVGDPNPPGGPTPPAAATALDHAHVRVTWPATSGAERAQILRDGILLDSRPAAVGRYVDSMLWFSTTYAYTIRMLDADGAVITTHGPLSATTAPLPPGGFPVAFASTAAGAAIWATPIPAAPAISPRNAEFMSYLTAHATNPNLTTRRYGVPVYEAEANDALFGPFTCTYACDINRDGKVPMPPHAAPDEGTDHHMTVLSQDGSRAWDYYKPVKNGSGVWTGTGAGVIVDMRGSGIVPKTLAGANAANMASLAGLIRPEELAQGHIDHAVTIGIPGIAGGAPACPATHNVGTTSDPNALPEGARLQLDPAVDVDSLPIPAWQKTIARALQVYGAYVRDNAGALTVYAETSTPTVGGRRYDAWIKAGLGFSASAGSQGFSAAFPWNRLRVLDFKYGPDC